MTPQDKLLIDSATAFLLSVNLLVNAWEKAKEGRNKLLQVAADDAQVAASGLLSKVNRLGTSLDGALLDVADVANCFKDVLTQKTVEAMPEADIRPFIEALEKKTKS